MQNVRFAGFWIRFLAAFIDSILLSIGALLLFVPIMLVLGMSVDSMESYGNDNLEVQAAGIMLLMNFLFIGITTVGYWLYFALFESSARQATPGKVAVGLRVIGPQGERISFARATGRLFGKYLSGMICYIGYIMAGFTEYKQALHDMMASTYVIYNNPYEAPAEHYQPPPTQSTPPPPTPGT